ncbi:protein-serine/threonine phosphatase [Salvia divinorum]|uniref:Protein-serine/threonine phosphatase n=1 Tax=Salvia divinorum TaxID=28513 RepID=A0ABD1I6V6_SALDI
MPSNNNSRFRGAIWQEFWRSIYRQETGIQGQIDDLIGQRRLLVSRSRLLHFVISETNSDLHALVRSGTLAAGQEDIHLANRRKNLSVARAYSRAISIPSIFRPSFQVCGYHSGCLLSGPSEISGISSQKSPMAGCVSRLSLTECSNGNLSPRHVKTWCCCRKGNINPLTGFGFEGSYLSSPAFSSSDTAPEVSFENSMKEEQRSTSADSSDLNSPITRALKLNSGSCYLPPP